MTCEHCGAQLALAPVGRMPRFCSTRCRVASHRSRSLPVEMTSRPRWVRHAAKRPLTVTGRQASITSPRTWAPYADVVASSVGDGVGFVLGDGIGCVDLDHCIEGAVLAPWAQAILARCPRTYVEVSPSGTGLHIFGLLSARPGRGQRGGVPIEVYSASRYMTVTGVRFRGAPHTLADLSEVVSTL